MKAAIIAIGDELLIGQTIDTNSAWIGKQLSKVGVQVVKKWTISDTESDILNTLSDAQELADLVLITGGLGPTKDDITKHCLCTYFGTHLVRNPTVEVKIRRFFEQLDRPILEVNLQQADLPESCVTLNNAKGTASGMWFEEQDTIFVSMPGVPYEMKAIMEEEVFPKLQGHEKLTPITHKMILTQGVGESFLAEIIKDWENSLEEVNVKLAYLPSPGLVKLRLSMYTGSSEKQKQIIKKKVAELYQLIPTYIFAEDDTTIEQVVHRLLIETKMTLSIAESCTGGYLAFQFTKQAGASAYFKSGVVAYTEELKQNLLGVKQTTLEKYGVVSTQVAEEMAVGIREKTGSTVAIATTGIAGPDGGTEAKPVGMICWSIALPNNTLSFVEKYGSDRQRNIERVSKSILNYLRKELLDNFPE